jgi:hypothetical protein
MTSTTQKPTYFLAPLRPSSPSGPIRLGSILTSPTRPDEPLHQPSLPSSQAIATFTEHDWSGSYTEKRPWRFGLWTSFAEMLLGASLDTSYTSNKGERRTWDVGTMTTRSFSPSMPFLEEVVRHEAVSEYVKATLFGEKIYMVTGVMVAECTTMLRESLSERGVYVRAGVDATPFTAVPVAAGPEGEWGRETSVAERSQRDEEFVFAFRVREVKVHRKGGVKSHRACNDGALFSKEDLVVAEEAVEIEVEGLDEEDVDVDEFGLESKEVTQAFGEDGEMECICVLPEPLD